MQLLRLACLTVGFLGITVSYAQRQLFSDSSEVDTVMLRELRWGMTVAEVRQSLRDVTLKSKSDTTLEYANDALGLKANVLLFFEKGRRQLTSAKVLFEGADKRAFEMILKQRREQLGEPDDHRKKEEITPVGRIALEVHVWKKRGVRLIHFSRGGKTLEVSLFFSSRPEKQIE